MKAFFVLSNCFTYTLDGYKILVNIHWSVRKVGLVMRKKLMVGIGILILLLLTACNTNETKEEIKNIKEVVHDYTVGTFDNVSASITSHELIVTDEKQKQTRYELPEDEFFVSIAPFMEVTHDCAIHSLTGCQGELVEEDFDVYIEDEDGNVVVDETITTFENGFIDLWLPRDRTYQVEIKQEDKVAVQELSTFKDDITCITTMQLN